MGAPRFGDPLPQGFNATVTDPPTASGEQCLVGFQESVLPATVVKGLALTAGQIVTVQWVASTLLVTAVVSDGLPPAPVDTSDDSTAGSV